MNLEDLRKPFSDSEVKTRPGGGGKELKYLERQSYENRLDDVVGAENWQSNHRIVPSESGDIYLCAIGILIKQEWVWKEDGADKTNQEGIKGGLTDSFKRACARWGIGRYLYEGEPAEEPWSVAQKEAVTKNTREVSDVDKFLELSGLARDATVKTVAIFTKRYQGYIDEGMNRKDALKTTKENK